MYFPKLKAEENGKVLRKREKKYEVENTKYAKFVVNLYHQFVYFCKLLYQK